MTKHILNKLSFVLSVFAVLLGLVFVERVGAKLRAQREFGRGGRAGNGKGNGKR